MNRQQIQKKIETLKSKLHAQMESYERHTVQQHIFHLQQELAQKPKGPAAKNKCV